MAGLSQKAVGEATGVPGTFQEDGLGLHYRLQSKFAQLHGRRAFGESRMNDRETSASFNPEILPATGRNNLWFRQPDSDTALVFVHGVLSDSRSCWLSSGDHGQAYWPQLIA